MLKRAILAAALPIVVLAGCASMSGGPFAMKEGVLVNDKGLTLYTFDRDVANSGKSVCNAACAVAWPPVMAGANDTPRGDYTIVVRDDGKRQWAHRGKPLYTWPEDQDPGDKYGDNKNNVWHVVK